MSWPFSKERLFLYLSFVIYSFIVIYAITYIYPNYFNETIVIFLAVMFFSYGAYLISRLTGVYKKVQEIEGEIYRQEIKKVYAHFYSEKKSDIRNSASSKETKVEKEEWIEFEKAQWSWKGKTNRELTAAERYFKTENSLRRINTFDRIINLISSHCYGFFILVNPLYAFLTTIPVVIISLVLFLIYRKLRKKLQELYIEVYPENVRETLESLGIK